MRVALIGDNCQITVTVNKAEYRGLLGYLGSHCDFGLTPESVFAAWEENAMRTLRDVLQFIIDNADNVLDRQMASGELEVLNGGGHLVDFVIQRTVTRRILCHIPGVAKTRVKILDNCTLDASTLNDIVEMMCQFGSETTPV
jgi:hypothetical protein